MREIVLYFARGPASVMAARQQWRDAAPESHRNSKRPMMYRSQLRRKYPAINTSYATGWPARRAPGLWLRPRRGHRGRTPHLGWQHVQPHRYRFGTPKLPCWFRGAARTSVGAASEGSSPSCSRHTRRTAASNRSSLSIVSKSRMLAKPNGRVEARKSLCGQSRGSKGSSWFARRCSGWLRMVSRWTAHRSGATRWSSCWVAVAWARCGVRNDTSTNRTVAIELLPPQAGCRQQCRSAARIGQESSKTSAATFAIITRHNDRVAAKHPRHHGTPDRRTPSAERERTWLHHHRHPAGTQTRPASAARCIGTARHGTLPSPRRHNGPVTRRRRRPGRGAIG